MNPTEVENELDVPDQEERAWAMAFSPPVKGAVLAREEQGTEGATRLRVQQFAERPVLDFAKVEVGASKTLFLELENATASEQELTAHKVPINEGFRIGDDASAPPAASLAWAAHLQPQATLLLPVTFAPPRVAAAAQTLTLRLDGRHMLQVRLVGSGVQPAAAARGAKPRAAISRASSNASDVLREANRGPAPPSAEQQTFKVPAARPRSAAQTPRGSTVVPGATAQPPRGSAVGPGATAARPLGPPSRVPPGPRGAPPASLRLKRAPAAVAGSAGAAPEPAEPPGAGERQQEPGAGAPLVTPRSQIVRARPAEPPAPSPVPSTPRSLTTPRGASLGGARGAPGALRSSAALPRDGLKALRPGVAGSVAGGSSSRGGRSSPGGSAGPPGSSTSKKARKTFSYFHTELWMQKQDKAFTSWLNHLLAPGAQDGAPAGAAGAAGDDGAAGALNDRRLAACMQGALVTCYRRDEGLRDAMMRVEARVDQGQLRLKDAALQMSDVAARDRAVAVLLSYHPFWLRLGLEVVTQRAVGGAHGGGSPLHARAPEDELRAFLLEHFLGDEDLARESAAARGAAHYDTAEYWRDLGEIIVKRFLLLALLLDRVAAAASDAHAPVPLLFGVDSTIKSTGEAVHEFLHGRLIGEGNLLRHLDLLGYKPRYKQSPLAEYPYRVTNLAVDLRDGLRLVRLAELLADAPALSEQARFPSDRRPLALHNIGLALTALRAAGVPLDAVPTGRGLAALKAEDIADGDRDRTLALLWAAARALQLPRLLRPSTLRAEVARVLARGRRGPRRALPGAAGARAAAGGAGAGDVPLAVYMNDELACLLMEWVQAVCAQWGVAVRNFTTAFGDGRVLCLLVAYYLPNALDVSAIYSPDADAERAAAAADFAALAEGLASDERTAPGGWCALFDAGGCVRDGGADRHRAGVAANFAAVHRAARSLGAVPEMLSSGDWAEHGPDERAVMLYAAFLCGRLLETSREDRAAHVLQRAWRDHRARATGSARANLQAWVAAAAVVTRAARVWLFRRAVGRMLGEVREAKGAAVALQAAWRGRAARAALARREEAAACIQRRWRVARVCGRRARAATVIQAGWKGHRSRRQTARRGAVARRDFQRTRDAAVCVQSLGRARLAALELGRRRAAALAARRAAAAVAVQSAWRAHAARDRFLQERLAVVRAQALARGALVRRRLAARRAAAARIQAAYRGHAVRSTLRASARFAAFLQALYRCGRARAAFLRLRGAAAAAQAARRGAVARRAFLERRAAAVAVQSAWRARVARRALGEARGAATAIQAGWRRHAAQQQLRQARAAATALQAGWRMFAASQALGEQRRAAATLQRAWRCKVAARQLAEHKAAAAIQAGWRRHVAEAQLRQARSAATAIQAGWRQHKLRSCYGELLAAAVTLQAAARGRLARARLQQQQAAATEVQCAWRCREARRLLAQHKAAALIQAHARGLAVRRRIALLTTMVKRLQAGWRCSAARRAYQQQRSAAVALQAAARGWQVRRTVARQAAAATAVQAGWRRHAAEQRLRQARAAATALQAAWRMHAAATALASQRRAALVLQSAWRCKDAVRQLAEHRAAAAIQAGWRRHKAQAALAEARSAATAVQAGWRRHVAQQQLRQARAAATALQAAWRMFAASQALAAQREAAATLQRAWRCKAAARHLAEHKAAAAIQAGWRRHVAEAQLQQARGAATAIQAGWRRHAAESQLQQARGAATAIQAGWRRHAAQAQLQQVRGAATAIQSGWRRHTAEAQLQQARGAATAIQAGWRRHAAEARLQQARRAAVAVQAVWRMFAASQALAAQREAAATLQRAWRCKAAARQLAEHKAAAAIQAGWRRHVAEGQLQRARSAATAVQAGWRGHVARGAYQQQRAAAVRIQVAARMLGARGRFVQLRAAAVSLQAAARGRQARVLAQRMRAAVEIQRRWRGKAARLQLARTRAAALCLQCMGRGLLARRNAQAVRDYMRSAQEFQAMLMELHNRTTAATMIQSAWRARAERAAFAPVWGAHQRAKAEAAAAGVIQRAWHAHRFRSMLGARAAARAAITRNLPFIRARLAYLRARRAALQLQRAWRDHQFARARAALALQCAARGALARRRARRVIESAVRIQAAWRGHAVRRSAGRSGREARQRLEAAAAAAETAPHRRIGARAKEALKVLLASKSCAQVITAVGAIEFSTRYSKECCGLIADSGGVPALLTFMRGCNRSKPHAEMLRLALAVLHNVGRWRDLAPRVLAAPECVAVLSERLQMFRDMEDIFLSVVGLLSKLAATEAGALAVASDAGPALLRQWEGVAAIIGRKMDMERKYIARLEGQKGSDASAREATRKMVSGAKQLEALSCLIRRVTDVAEAHGLPLVHQAPPGGGGDGGGGGGLELPPLDAVAHPEGGAGGYGGGGGLSAWKPKNTLVRGVFRDMSAAAAAEKAAAAAAEKAAAAAGGADRAPQHDQQPAAQRRRATPASGGAPGLWLPPALGHTLAACAAAGSSGSSGGGSSRSGRSGDRSGQGAPGGGGLPPKVLTSRIKGAADLAALEQLEAQRGASFDFIHTSAAFARAGNLAAARGAPPHPAFHPLLRRLWQRLQPQLGECGPRQLANIVWACGKAGFVEAPLLDACLAQLCGSAGDADPQALANAVYATAVLRDSGYTVDEQQARQLVAALVQQRHEAEPQQLANALWAAATLGLPLPQQQAAQLTAALVQQRHEAEPQHLANALWAAATMGLPLPQQQAQQLVAALVQRRQEADPQAIANSLWAAATMGLPLPEQAWERLLAALMAQAQRLKPQAVSNTLWAAAKRKADFAAVAVAARKGGVTAVEAALLQLAAAVSKEQVASMIPQHISNSLWTLSELGLHPPWLTALLAEAALRRVLDMAPQDISNTALALARLGLHGVRLFAALAGAAAQQGQRFLTVPQHPCNLAWAVAIADQRQLSGTVVVLCRQLACSSSWGSTVTENQQQLLQVHLWLQDGQPVGGGGSGLAAALSAVQLQQCGATWEEQQQLTAQQRRTELERQVFARARRLPNLADCRQEARTPDCALRVDVAATHAASGRLLAIEADGPTHFLRPSGQPTGVTLARNRALAARGYVVVPVPWQEWARLVGGAPAQDAYLQRRVEAALKAQQPRRPDSGPGGGGAAAAA
ncbi:MAG: hypothetical protein J3K34DRAFT_517600 [Monoraphidium minutum]|nr:MAG: hypothetical protein J3K34DRAFT_517600 [Monoraphidium minutum]